VLSVRDERRWAESMFETVWAVRKGGSLTHLLSDARAKVDPDWAAFLDLIDGLLWQDDGTFALANSEAEDLIAPAREHRERVEAAIDPERLLIWDVSEGWGPLCGFLELPEPNVELPHINDRLEFAGRIADGALQALSQWRAEQASAEAAPVRRQR